MMGIALAGCGGGGGGGPTSTPVTDPVLSNLNVATSSAACTARGLPGLIRTISFNFSDPEGDVKGGEVHLELFRSFGVPGGGFFERRQSSEQFSEGLGVGGDRFLDDLTLVVPSKGVTLAGTTSGTITVSSLCIAVGARSATLTVSLFDVAGHGYTLHTEISGT